MIGVYKITNKINGKVYIGSSKNIETRWKQHIQCLDNNNHHCLRLQEDWNKYGIYNFIFEIEHMCNNIDELTKYEQKYINKYIDNLYNSNLISYKENTKNTKGSTTYKTYIPKTTIIKNVSIESYRLLFYILNKIRNDNRYSIKFGVKNYNDHIESKSNSIYSRIDDCLKEVQTIIPIKYKLINNSIIKLDLDENYFLKLCNKKDCIKLTIDEKDIYSNKLTRKDIIILLLVLINNKEVNISLSGLKHILNCSDKYDSFADFNKTILIPSIKNLKCVNYNLITYKIKLGRTVDRLKLVIRKK